MRFGREEVARHSEGECAGVTIAFLLVVLDCSERTAQRNSGKGCGEGCFVEVGAGIVEVQFREVFAHGFFQSLHSCFHRNARRSTQVDALK